MYKKQIKWTSRFITFLLLFSLCACNSTKQASNTPTLTPEPTSTLALTATIAPTSTKTDPKIVPLQVELGLGRDFAPLGFFTYNNLDHLNGDYGWDLVTFRDEDQSVIISFIGSYAHDFTTSSSEEIVNGYIEALNQKTEGTLTITGSPETIIIDGIDSLIYEVDGKLNGNNTYGKAFLARLDGDRTVFGFGLSLQEPAREVWMKRGEESYRAFIGSLQFIQFETVQRGCQVSTDPTYGYSQDNPVLLGGANEFSPDGEFDFSSFDGVRREDIYLMLLSGPNGEQITYPRIGSITYGDTILDEYSITIEGDPEPKIIYVDIYHFSPPFAPMGFSCYSYLPFEEPR